TFTLDPFARLRALANAPTRDWAQIEAETDRLKRAGKEVPADLKDKVNPIGGLAELCAAAAKDWAHIAAEGDRLLATGRVLTPDVKRVYDDARKRVACRDAVKRALDARDPRAVVTAYQPALVDDWADAALLTGAKAAAGQVALLDKLKAASANPGDGRALVKLWDESAAKVSGLTEAKNYEAAAIRWRARIKAADMFLAAFAKVPQSERELAEAWQAVLMADPAYPALSNVHRKRGEDALRWWPVLDKLQKIPTRPAHENDAKLVSAWGDGSALAGCAAAGIYSPRVTEARARLKLVEALERAIKHADAGGSEDAVIQAAAKLPPNYPHPYANRVGEGTEALRLTEELHQVVGQPQPSDRAIATAYERLKARNPRFAAQLGRVNPRLLAEAELAVQRRDLLDRFAQIDRTEKRADKQDRKWFELWAEQGKLLIDRADREELRTRLTLARERLAKWGKVYEALKARDIFGLRKSFMAYGADLLNYPPLLDRMGEIESLMEKADRVADIKEKIDLAVALSAEDMGFLKDNHAAFDAETKKALEAQVRAKLAGDARLIPAYPAYTLTGRRGGLVKACWSWGGQGLIAYCVVAVDGRRFLTDPADADPYSRLKCLPDTHQREGGGVTLVPPADATSAYVTIWPVVELGWKAIAGPPLNIGPVPVGAGSASATGSRW
ncbi:MAG: hypothetical protein K2V38_05950, partial [Gemmataceae bacterium]|nr:hypothetical protein [Gemmataceae bacterium]